MKERTDEKGDTKAIWINTGAKGDEGARTREALQKPTKAALNEEDVEKETE